MDSVSGLSTSRKTQKKESSPTSAREPSRKPVTYHGVVQPAGFPGLPPDWLSEWETFHDSQARAMLFAVIHRQRMWTEPTALVILHGLGEHGGRYLHFPHYLAGGVQCLYAPDQRAHGRSEGLRGHAEHFDAFCEDAAMMIRRVHSLLLRKFGQSKIHLLGHSMGGLVAIRTLFLHPDLPIKSATVSAPLLAIKMKVPPVKRAAALALSKFWGSLHMTTDLDPAVISHDREVVDAYRRDRLVHTKITPSFFTALLTAMEDTRKRVSKLACPIQFMLPLEDMLVDSDATKAFYKSLKQKDKALKTYRGFYHEIFNEIGKEKAFRDLKSWIAAHQA